MLQINMLAVANLCHQLKQRVVYKTYLRIQLLVTINEHNK